MQKLPSVLIASLLVLTCLPSCMSPSKFASRFSADPQVVPADFNPSRHILLVAEMPRLNNPAETNEAVTRKLDEALQKYCPYKYKIVPMKDIQDKSKYSDTSVYKYAIVNSLHITTHGHKTTVTQTNTVTGRRESHSVSPTARTTKAYYNFYDRFANYNFPSTHSVPQIEHAVAGFMETVKKTMASR